MAVAIFIGAQDAAAALRDLLASFRPSKTLQNCAARSAVAVARWGLQSSEAAVLADRG